jgi:hypothetical protein
MSNSLNKEKLERPFQKVTANGMLYGQGSVLSLHNPKVIHDLKVAIKRGVYDNSDLVGISLDVRI